MKLGLLYTLVGTTLLVGLGVGGLVGAHYADKHPQIAPPLGVDPASLVYRKYTEDSSTGGHTATKDSATATGSEFDGRGDNAKASDVKVESGHASLKPGESAETAGGGLSGDFASKVNPKTLTIIALIGAALFGISAYSKYKIHPTDWHQWAGAGCAAVGCFLVAIDNSLFWYGLLGAGVYVGTHLLPTFSASGAATAQGALASIQNAFKNLDPNIQTSIWTAIDKSTTPEQDIAIAQAAKKGGV